MSRLGPMVRPLALLGLLVLAAPAKADPAAALEPVVRQIYLEARRLEARGDLEGAATRYRAVLRADPAFIHAVVDLGRVLQANGDARGAITIYGMAPFDAEAVEALGRLYLQEGRHRDALTEFRKLQALTGSPEAHLLEARALLGSDPERAAEVFRRYLGFDDADLDAPGAVEAAVAIADGLRAGHGEAVGHAFLEDMAARWPEAESVPVLKERLDRFRVEERARRLAGAAAQGLSGRQLQQLEDARAAFAAGDAQGAHAALTDLVRQAPRSPEAWAALSDVAEAVGDVAEAEQALLRAETLAPLDPRHPARLGDLLARHYAGRHAVEAAEAWRRALRLNPNQPELWARVADAHRGTPEAAAAWRAYLALAPDGPHAERAQAALQGLARERPPAPVLDPAPGRPDGIPEEAWRAFWIAYVYDAEQRPEEALDELRRALESHPRFTKALNLEARILLARGEQEAAMALYVRSLELEPAQWEVLVMLGELHHQRGDSEEASRLWREAAALGAADPHYWLARAAWSQGSPWAARRHLRAYFEGATSGRFHESARQLEQEVEQQIRLAGLLGAGGVGLTVGLPLLFWHRRRSGQGLSALLDASPLAWREVARVASAIRHEVLKHNTTVLPLVADALDDRDPEPAGWAAERLFDEGGALARLSEHIAELEQLGRLQGVRLNLRHRDPVFGPLLAGVDRLRRLERDMRQGGGRRLAAELREISQVINDEAYRRLGRLVRSLCLLELDEALLRASWERVLDEPSFRGVEAPRLVLAPVPSGLHLRIFRGEIGDILANVLRNSLQATLEAGASRVGLRVVTEEDPITGLERVALRVQDDAPRRITTAVIRGRYIERGLGLTVDLISRNGGSIHVEAESGWSKAVVVRLPRAEAPESLEVLEEACAS